MRQLRLIYSFATIRSLKAMQHTFHQDDEYISLMQTHVYQRRVDAEAVRAKLENHDEKLYVEGGKMLFDEARWHDMDFSEDRYQEIARLRDDIAMADFAKGFLHVLGKEVVPEQESDLAGFIPWFSGNNATQSLQQMRTELLSKGWVQNDMLRTIEIAKENWTVATDEFLDPWCSGGYDDGDLELAAGVEQQACFDLIETAAASDPKFMLAAWRGDRPSKECLICKLDIEKAAQYQTSYVSLEGAVVFMKQQSSSR